MVHVWLQGGFLVSSLFVASRVVVRETRRDTHSTRERVRRSTRQSWRGTQPQDAVAAQATEKKRRKQKQAMPPDLDVQVLDQSENSEDVMGGDTGVAARRSPHSGGSESGDLEVAPTPVHSDSSNSDVIPELVTEAAASAAATPPVEASDGGFGVSSSVDCFSERPVEPAPRQEVLENTETILDAVLSGSVGHWFDFRFAVKQKTSAPPFGGIEARCRWHARSDVTGCKRFLGFRGEGREDQLFAVRSLQHWCNHAQRFAFQRTHVRMPLLPAHIPPPALVHEQKPTVAAPEAVVSDAMKDVSSNDNKSNVTKKKGCGEKARKKPEPKAETKPEEEAESQARSTPALQLRQSRSSSSSTSSTSGSTSSSSSTSGKEDGPAACKSRCAHSPCLVKKLSLRQQRVCEQVSTSLQVGLCSMCILPLVTWSGTPPAVNIS